MKLDAPKPADFPLCSMESRADSKSRSRNVLGEEIGGTERSFLFKSLAD